MLATQKYTELLMGREECLRRREKGVTQSVKELRMIRETPCRIDKKA